jgi:hypothetical protein
MKVAAPHGQNGVRSGSERGSVGGGASLTAIDVTSIVDLRGGRMRPTNLDKSRQPRRWKPLSQAQENALILLIQGKRDGEAAADPGVDVTR